LKHIIFTVTNDLNYDQRMIRICNSLVENGYAVKLVGVSKRTSETLQPKNYIQKRLPIIFSKGILFYAEYNIRLFFYLLFCKEDAFCAIDLDTIMPVYFVSVFRRKKRIYDAHEYFSQQKEIITRKTVYKVWHAIEKQFVPKFKSGYTVSASIAKEFKNLYNVKYDCIRNMPTLQLNTFRLTKEKNILYQGAVNEGRGFEGLIPAMQFVDAYLIVYGDGNFMEETKALIKKYNVQDKVSLKGKLLPADLEKITRDAYIGINLVEHKGLNQYYSLANKFFDYIQNAVPQITMNFPEYKAINDNYNVALLLDDIDANNIANAINNLLNNEELYKELRANCIAAAYVFNWKNEEENLLDFYTVFFE
jgi:glycosyltransferase involved in cell wall biosynthesis